MQLLSWTDRNIEYQLAISNRNRRNRQAQIWMAVIHVTKPLRGTNTGQKETKPVSVTTLSKETSRPYHSPNRGQRPDYVGTILEISTKNIISFSQKWYYETSKFTRITTNRNCLNKTMMLERASQSRLELQISNQMKLLRGIQADISS